MDTKQLIAEMFSAENFRESGHALIELLAHHLEQNIHGKNDVLNWQNPVLEDTLWQQALPQKPTLNCAELLAKLNNEILPKSLAIHHPHNLGHQVATPLPMAALCDLVAALTNQAMAVYETGPSATMLERQVIRWLSDLIGWQQHETLSNGILTSGGAQANLTALLAARQHSAPWDIWEKGIRTHNDEHAGSHPYLCILASEHAHYSVARAAGMMGLGTNAVIKIKADALGRMDVMALKTAHADCLSQQQLVIAVVATAGCTPTGSIDPLVDIARYCNTQGLWLHIDGAHGASALLSQQHRNQLEGIALADSVVWDGHKLLYMPAPVSAVLFKNPEHSYSAFAQDASYLFQGDSHEAESFNISYRTIECTKRMMALKLWAAFSLYGAEGLAVLVEEAFAKAQYFASMLIVDKRFQLLMLPQTNIVCFKHLALLSDGPFEQHQLNRDQLNQHQSNLRQKIIQSGEFHLTQVEIHGELWLRTTLMNPFTSQDDLQLLLDLMDNIAQTTMHKS